MIEYFSGKREPLTDNAKQIKKINFGPFKLMVFHAPSGAWNISNQESYDVDDILSFNQMVNDNGDKAYWFTFKAYRVAVMLRNPDNWINDEY